MADDIIRISRPRLVGDIQSWDSYRELRAILYNFYHAVITPRGPS